MIADAVAGLGGVALFAGSGLGLTELSPCLRRLSWAHRLGYSLLLGIAAVCGALYGLSHLVDLPLRGPWVWTLAGLCAAAGLGARLRRAEPGFGGRRAGPALARAALHRRRSERLGRVARGACLGIAALVGLGVLANALADPVADFDGRMTWSAQARYVRAAGTVDAGVLRDARWFVSHPRYPLLLPLAQVAVLEAFALDDDSHAVRGVYAACFAAWLLVLHHGARRLSGRGPAAIVTLVAAATPFFVGADGGASSTYSDMPLACFYGAALVLLLTAPPRLAIGWEEGLLLAGAVLCKNEGAPLAAVAWSAGALVALGAHGPHAARRWRRRLLLAAALPAASFGLLVSWRSAIPNREDEDYFAFVRLGDVVSGLFSRLALVGPNLLRRMASWRDWGIFWWMVPAVLIAGWRALGRRRGWLLLAAAAAPPAIGWAAYAVHWNPLALAAATWERFLLQGSIPLLLLLAGALAEVLGRANFAAGRHAASSEGKSREFPWKFENFPGKLRISFAATAGAKKFLSQRGNLESFLETLKIS